MHTLRIKIFLARQCIQFLYNLGTSGRSALRTNHTEVVSTVADTYAEALFYLSKVFVKLATEIGQHTIIGGLEQEFPGFYGSIQRLSRFQARILSGGLRLQEQTPAQGIGPGLSNSYINKATDNVWVRLKVHPAIVFGPPSHFAIITN